jgi:MFS family permease
MTAQERTEGGQRSPSDFAEATTEANVIATTNLYFLPVPKRLRYRQDKPFPFGLALNFLFAAASTATVSNLYYAQPILSYLSDEFQVTYADISLAPTLTQAGYAVGILLISPLGDLVRRRSLVLLLVACTIALSIGVATSLTLLQFEIINFLCALLTVSVGDKLGKINTYYADPVSFF